MEYMDFSSNFRGILLKAKLSAQNKLLTPTNLLVGVLVTEDSDAYQILYELVDVDSLIEKHAELYNVANNSYVNDQENSAVTIRMTNTTEEIIHNAKVEANAMNAKELSSVHILLSLAKFNVIEGVSYDEVKLIVEKQGTNLNKNENENMSNKGELLIEQFSDDLTKKAEEGKLDPVVGRKDELRRLAQILARRKKNNPVLVGNPGVGKTAVVEGLAQNIVKGNVPEGLENKRILALNMAAIVAGTKYRGEFEERMKKIADELKEEKDIIVYIDEIHTIMGAGGSSGSLDAANILKPSLANGEINCIGSTTFEEYRNIEKDAALDRRFQKIKVVESTYDETFEILKNLKERYENHHMVKYTDEAIAACVKLSDRYISDRFFPDKAIDVLDEAGSSVRLDFEVPSEIAEIEAEILKIREEKIVYVKDQEFEEAARMKKLESAKELEITQLKKKVSEERSKNPTHVTVDDVAFAVSIMTGIPSTNINENDVDKLINLTPEMKKVVIGQDDAIDKLVKAILRNSAGLGDTQRPIGTFIFSGSTGVGKTHIAKKLAERLFTSEADMIRIDMSEYMEKHTVSKLIGSPPGYVGYDEAGQLTEKVRQNPYSIILLDEIEKAHKDVLNVLLQLLDDGQLTDGQGRTVNFKNTIIICTSNVGSRAASEAGGIGFGVDSNDHAKGVIEKEIKKHFAPEFLNRIDEIIHFNKLNKEDISKIIKIELNSFVKNVESNGITIKFDDSAFEFLQEKGYDADFGARPLKRAIRKYIEDEISVLFITKKFVDGDTIIASHEKGSDELTFVKDTNVAEIVDSIINSGINE